MNIIVAGIGTEVGKTVVSAILCEALNAHYWKPVQAGELDNTDTHFVSHFLSNNPHFKAWPEQYRLTQPMSPHAAAKIDQVEITLESLSLPDSDPQQNRVIELAGGLMVPLSDHLSNMDLITQLNCPVVLVANYYLGSINHTLLSLSLLATKNIPILGIIFNGEPNLQSRDVILKQSDVALIGEVPYCADIDLGFIQTHAEKFDNTQQWLEFDQQHLWHPYTSMKAPLPCYPVVATNGAYLELDNGEKLLDGMSSWWCALHGYNHPQLTEAVSKQLQQMPHVMFGGIAHPMASELGKRLIDITPDSLQHVFLADSGSIAIEVALKMALQYWQSIGQPNKRKLLTVLGGYHGDPFACMSVGDPDNGQHHLFSDMISKQLYAERPKIAFDHPWDDSDIESLRQILEQHHHQIAGIIVEPIVQGAVSMRFYHPQYLAKLRELCDEYSVLLIFDEIATGFGRTGKLFAMDHAGIVPDIVSVGKALTGGMMTLAATLANSKVSDGISDGSAPALMHGPTFMANPLACAAACASIDVLLDESASATYPSGWQQTVRTIEKGLQALKQISDHHAVAEVRVLGAIGVVEMKDVVDVAKVQATMVKQNVWIRPFGRLIYVMPPYILQPHEIKKLCDSIINTVHSLY